MARAALSDGGGGSGGLLGLYGLGLNAEVASAGLLGALALGREGGALGRGVELLLDGGGAPAQANEEAHEAAHGGGGNGAARKAGRKGHGGGHEHGVERRVDFAQGKRRGLGRRKQGKRAHEARVQCGVSSYAHMVLAPPPGEDETSFKPMIPAPGARECVNGLCCVSSSCSLTVRMLGQIRIYLLVTGARKVLTAVGGKRPAPRGAGL